MPAIPYTQVQSQFIKAQIEAGSFDDAAHREYVDDLILLEYFICNGPSGMASGMAYHAKRSQYEEEFERIYRELDPDGWKQRQAKKHQREEQQRQAREQRRKEQVQEERRNRAEWETVASL